MAWEKALTKTNIFSAFAAGGIHPLNPSVVLDQIRLKTPSPISSDEETKRKTPGSVRAVRRQIKAVQKAHGQLDDQVELLARACEKLLINKETLEHENEGLQEALKTETKASKTGQKDGFIP